MNTTNLLTRVAIRAMDAATAPTPSELACVELTEDPASQPVTPTLHFDDVMRAAPGAPKKHKRSSPADPAEAPATAKSAKRRLQLDEPAKHECYSIMWTRKIRLLDGGIGLGQKTIETRKFLFPIDGPDRLSRDMLDKIRAADSCTTEYLDHIGFNEVQHLIGFLEGCSDTQVDYTPDVAHRQHLDAFDSITQVIKAIYVVNTANTL